jgi:hypothetical protein
MKKLVDFFLFCMGLHSKTQTGKDAEHVTICDFSGQGREGGDKS